MERPWVKMVWPILVSSKQKPDRRQVNTFLRLVMAIIKHRHPNNRLLLSKLGGYVRPPITDQTFVPEIYISEDKAGDAKH
jgi:hypothetical protein